MPAFEGVRGRGGHVGISRILSTFFVRFLWAGGYSHILGDGTIEYKPGSKVSSVQVRKLFP